MCRKVSCPHTLSNYLDVTVTKYHFDLTVDFDAKCLRGFADISIHPIKPTKLVVLDTADLLIESAWLQPSSPGQPPRQAVFDLRRSDLAWSGSALTLTLSEEQSADFVVRVQYRTLPSSSGLQWLTPEQTAGGVHPFCYSQFQAIHARSAFPCQDTPYCKAPYTATLRVPPVLAAYMSAKRTGANERTGEYTFEQPLPIPTYLVALAVGNLRAQRIGPRSSVVCEPETLSAAFAEFDGHPERFLVAAEELTGLPYAWEVYDVLVLPPSFPYGGMENPMLTFVTPSLLAGDSSLVDVVAHEAAHSWAGNLVTNATWEHFWLNEGFCVFLERKIIGRLRGEAERQLAYVIGHAALADSVKRYGAEGAAYTSLVQDLHGVDPDDAFSSVPYERGSQFLLYLEGVVGGPAVFEPFFAAYFAHFAKHTLTSFDFRAFFEEYFGRLPNFDATKLREIDWTAWFDGQGMPPVDMWPRFDHSLSAAANALAELFALSPEAEVREKAKAVRADSWSPPQQILFLTQLVELTRTPNPPLSEGKVALLGELYGFDRSMNSEIRFKYCMLSIAAGYEPGFAGAVDMAKGCGRMKYARPLYRALFDQPKTKANAVSTFQGHRAFYHNICAKMIARDLKIEN